MSKGFKLRMEEYVPTGTFLKTSFTKDRAELATRFAEFTTEYEVAFIEQLTKVAKLEQTLKLTEKQKKVTETLYEKADLVNKEFNFLSFYFKRAGLDSSILTDVKNDLASKNIEGACFKMEGLMQYVADNKTVLVSKGMAAGFVATLETDVVDLSAKNELQTEVMNIKGQLHRDNASEYKKLYAYISTIAAAGKIMYDGAGKMDEYTLSKVLSRMRIIKSGKVPPSE